MASSFALVAIRGSPARAFLGSFIMGGLESHDPRPGRSKPCFASIADDGSLGKGVDQDDFVPMPNRKDLGGVPLWKALGKKSGTTYAVMDAGTASAYSRQGDFSGWRVRIPAGSSPTVRYLVFPQGSLLRSYWEEFLFSGWGWLNSEEFEALMDKHFHAGARSVIKPSPGP